MKRIDQFKDKKILVLGLAKSGLNVAKLLHELGALLTVNDYKPFDENPEARELLNLGIKVITGEHPTDLLEEQFELVVKNPGIPYSNPVVQAALRRHIPIVTEVEVASLVAESRMIAITGTNGKTTTTALTTAILNENRTEGQAYAVGNIGVPISQVVREAGSVDDLVTEMSSFQLLATPSLRPTIAAITNLYSAHLDYHGSREEYVGAKLNITANQTPDDYLIYNSDQDELTQLVKEKSQAQLIPFSIERAEVNGCYSDGQYIYFKEEVVAAVSDVALSGRHNLQNVLVAVGIAKLSGVSNEAIQAVLRQFSGVAHRSQYVATIDGRQFINDSKATNALATSKALAGFDQPIILLAGGLDRGESFDDLIPYLKQVKAVISFGETGERLQSFAKEQGVPSAKKVDTLTQAVDVGYAESAPGDVILLSPACASWDQYPNFEKRGDEFIELVTNLQRKDDNDEQA